MDSGVKQCVDVVEARLGARFARPEANAERRDHEMVQWSIVLWIMGVIYLGMIVGLSK